MRSYNFSSTRSLGDGCDLEIFAGIWSKFDQQQPPMCQVPCDHITQRVWRLSAARDAMNQLYQHLGT